MRILVIEDEDLLARVLGGHEVIRKGTVREARASLQDDGPRPDAVIINVVLPLLLALHASSRGIKTVLLAEDDHQKELLVALLHLLFSLEGGDESRVIVSTGEEIAEVLVK